VHGASAVAALTAQNTREVRGVRATDAGFLRDQIEAVLDDLPVAAVKTGMLATAATVAVVADLAVAGRLPNLVVDPVMVSSSGHRLLDPDAEAAYLELLVPHALVVTPNCREAAVLLGEPVDDLERQLAAAHHLVEHGATWAVVKGGDQQGRRHRRGLRPAVTSSCVGRLATRNNHGTGCSFASAIAAQLRVRGREPRPSNTPRPSSTTPSPAPPTGTSGPATAHRSPRLLREDPVMTTTEPSPSTVAAPVASTRRPRDREASNEPPQGTSRGPGDIQVPFVEVTIGDSPSKDGRCPTPRSPVHDHRAGPTPPSGCRRCATVDPAGRRR
jgi:hydroxymethylpyrimidine/phosphomethylpyrimidine kinase